MFKYRRDKVINNNKDTKNSVTNRFLCLTIKNSIVRGPFYIFGVVLLAFVLATMVVGYSTNHWKLTSKHNRTEEYFTAGLWYICRNVKIDWLKNHDIYCQRLNNSQSIKIFIKNKNYFKYFNKYFYFKTHGLLLFKYFIQLVYF